MKKMILFESTISILSCVGIALAAIVPPPWADPKVNPCALLPRGWQMLYWPPDGKCYKIFKMGHPCPATMELTPSKIGSSSPAECRCPPGTIRTEDSKVCYQVFTRGPCLKGEYFAPNASKQAAMSRLGSCAKPMACADETQAFWPPDQKCYRKLSRGPCPMGKIVHVGGDGITFCSCVKESSNTWEDNRCYEHYSKGPCPKGSIFMPEGRCGCTAELPHYDAETGACYEIGSIGPCKTGQRFSISMDSPGKAKCSCKPSYEPWSDGSCYRLYTRGPCAKNEFFTPTSKCEPLPCGKSKLYFADEQKCYKIGTQGPCKSDQVVIYDFDARPSIDGIAYNGVCGCSTALSLDAIDDCRVNRLVDSDCKMSPGMVAIDGFCYMLHTKGPCKDGQWLVPMNDNRVDENTKKAGCFCKPGFIKADDKSMDFRLGDDSCLPPTVNLARYLNERYNKGR